MISKVDVIPRGDQIDSKVLDEQEAALLKEPSAIFPV